MKFLNLILVLFIVGCGGKPADFAEKTYTLGDVNKNLLKLKTNGQNATVNGIEGPKKDSSNTSTFKLAGGFDKYVYQGDHGEILVIFPNGLALYKDKNFSFSAGFDTQEDQTNVNLDGTYNYISQEIYASTASSYSTSFYYGVIKVSGTSFEVDSAFASKTTGIIEPQKDGSFDAFLLIKDPADPTKTTKVQFANLFIKMTTV